ncbi:MAG TPA: ABC transporter ATP-binding protein [Bacillales bacterium]|nr:ABC transporter ATP-binding protein [Bacillales bacterium]
MTKTAVHFQNVTKQYGKKSALDQLNLSLPSGGIVGVLGPNGSGKSTLFRLITGLTRPDSGTISVLDQSPGWKTNANIAYLPDRARWYPDHTVERAFEWGQSFLPGFELQTAQRLAADMKLEPDMKADGMSRGQEARLMLILCIARKVPLIILDEPFSGIDALSREKIVEGLIDHMDGSGQTVLISTHEIHEAEGLFDRTVFLDNGQVKLTGEADELRREYGSMDTLLRRLYD